MIFPKLVVFDLDGTLIEFHHHYLLTETERILSHLEHHPVPREELAEHFSDFNFFGFVTAELREEFVKTFWSHFNWDSFPKPQPFAKSVEVLKVLTESGIRCAIATARIAELDELRRELEPTGFLPFISEIATRAPSQLDWTDKRPHFRELALRSGYDPADMLLVGDIPADIESAREAGVKTTVAVCSGGIKRNVLELASPDHILEDIGHLPALLKIRR